MSGTAQPALIAVFISAGVAIATASVSGWVALRARNRAAGRDTAASIFFAIAVAVMLLDVVSVGAATVFGLGFIGLPKAAALLTGAFAVAGAGMGLVRGLRSGHA